MAEKISEIQSDLQRIEKSPPLEAGQGISDIANALGIRESALKNIQDLWSLRAGDSFELSVDGSWKWMLTKITNRVKPYPKFELPKEAIYQNIESDNSWLNIAFIRLSDWRYQIVWKDKSIHERVPFFVKTTNLDSFRTRLSQESGKLIAECGSRSEQRALACSIKLNKNFPGVVDVNSTDLFDFLPKNIDISALTQLLSNKEKPTPEEFWKFIATFATQSASK
jgi:hypothetical protein